MNEILARLRKYVDEEDKTRTLIQGSGSNYKGVTIRDAIGREQKSG